MDMLKRFWQEEDGIATIEILLILAVLIVIALLFRKAIIEWVEGFLKTLFPEGDQTPEQPYQPGTNAGGEGGD